MSEKRSTIVTTGKVRLSYEHLIAPAAINDGDDPKYSASFIISKKDTKTIQLIEKAVQDAIKQGITSKWGGKKPGKLKLPLRDGDDERPDDEAYKDAYFINANCTTKYPPFIVDANKRPITNETEIYSGCYGLGVVSFYPFDVNGNRGVACGLLGFVKTNNGEPLASRISVDDALEGVDLSAYADDDDDLFD